MAKIKRILLECTHTYESGLNTGIQRVVRNIVRESEQISRELNVECKPLVVRHNCFITVDGITNTRSARAATRASLKKIYHKLRPILRTIIPLRNFTSSELGLVKSITSLLDILFFPLALIEYLRKKVVLREGDMVLLLDSSWVYPIWPAVLHAKKKGAVIGLVVYDIIPITHPHFMTLFLKKRFKQWFDKAITHSDFFIAISKTSCNEAKKYVESKYASENWKGKFESFQLGSVIDNVVSNGDVREELKNVFENSDNSNVYLTVGTIEPRKNHKYLMDAFDEIWRQCPGPRVCIIGRLGWFYSEFLERIKTHPQYGKCLFMFNDTSDTELDYCYSHAKALIFPSHAEGFGLPIVESLYHGLPVLASDIPIHREVGKDFCLYFDINDPADLTNIIINIEKTGKMPEVRKPEDYDLLTWKDSCRELLSKVMTLSEMVGEN